MKVQTKNKKEERIIDAAEVVFSEMGFKNTRMEDVAKKAAITKVTLYTYFQSKDNLIMAITYRALIKVKERYQKVLEDLKNDNGLECTVALMEAYMNFCEENYLYSEAMLEYFALVRSTSSNTDQTKLTEAMKESHYYAKIHELQNFPFKISAAAITRGIKDGSINSDIDPMFHTLHGWTVIVGYLKVMSAAGRNAIPLFKISLSDLKKFNLKLTRDVLSVRK